MIGLEFSMVDEDDIRDWPRPKRQAYLKRAKIFGIEGLRSAEALLPAGHTDLRVVVDSEWELAITCDRCGLWASMTQRVPYNKMSQASVSGALLEVVECSTTERHKRFGSYAGVDAWSGYTSWNFTEPLISHREGEYFYPEGKKKGRSGKKSGWMEVHDTMKKIEGVKDEATTKE